PGCRAKARIGAISAARPLPNATEHLRKSALAQCRRGLHRSRLIELLPAERVERSCCRLPFKLGRQSRAGPAGKGVGFVKTDMGDGRGGVDRLPARECEDAPFVPI